MLHQITYVSRSELTGDVDERYLDAGNIAVFSAVSNRARGICGALVFDGRFFAQVLEGPLERLQPLMARIARDRRHADVTIIRSRAIPKRSLSDWSMGYIPSGAPFYEIFNVISERAGVSVDSFTHDRFVEDLHCHLSREDRGAPALPPAALAQAAVERGAGDWAGS